MRLLLLFFMVFCLVCCQDQIQLERLQGRWKSRDLADKTGWYVTDKITFNKDGTFSIQIMSNKKVTEQISGTYKLDKSTNQLNLRSLDTNFTFQIMKLTNEDLYVQNIYQKKYIRYERY